MVYTYLVKYLEKYVCKVLPTVIAQLRNCFLGTHYSTQTYVPDQPQTLGLRQWPEGLHSLFTTVSAKDTTWLSAIQTSKLMHFADIQGEHHAEEVVWNWVRHYHCTYTVYVHRDTYCNTQEVMIVCIWVNTEVVDRVKRNNQSIDCVQPYPLLTNLMVMWLVMWLVMLTNHFSRTYILLNILIALYIICW